MAFQQSIGTVVNAFGQSNNAGDNDALFLKVFSGEVLAAFTRETKALPYVNRRTISNGKSVQFPAIGRQSAEYHTAGNRLNGSNIHSGERTIVIDARPLVAAVFIDQVDEAKSHFEVRSQYSTENGNALAWKVDKQLFTVAQNGARTLGTITDATLGTPSGTVIGNANMKTDALTLAGAIFKAAETLDNKSIPQTDRVCFLAPAQYYLLAQNTTAINKEFGGMGSYADGEIVKIAGIQLVKSINLPTTTQSGDVNTQYNTPGGNGATNLAGLIWHKSAVGLVDLIGVTSDMEERKSELGVLMFSKYLKGANVLRPEACIELTTATTGTGWFDALDASIKLAFT